MVQIVAGLCLFNGNKEKIYKFYSSPESLNEEMNTLANTVLFNLQEDNPNTAAIFFTECLRIKPFYDASNRIARLIAMAILAKQNLPIIDLYSRKARDIFELK